MQNSWLSIYHTKSSMETALKSILQYWMQGGGLLVPLAVLSLLLFARIFYARAQLRGLRFARQPATALEQIGKIRRNVPLMLAMMSAAPLLGLLGTVVGMIHTFAAVSSLDGKLESDMAGGISQALITTQVGLVIAIIALFGIVSLRKLIDQLYIQFELQEKVGRQ